MIKLSDYRTQGALPVPMRTPERIALSYAFDRQKKIYIERMQRAYIWADLEKVDDNKLDFLAVENRVLFYNSDLAPDVKRRLIRNSIYWYMKLGTRQVMEEMVDIVFGNENTSVEEWHTYAGEPFHFRIAVGTSVTQTSIKEFLQYLNRVKNARSRFDYMVFQNGITLTIYQVSEYQDFIYTFCGEFECGVYPNTETGLQPHEITLTLEGDAETGRTAYGEAGTKPDISVGAAFVENTLEIQPESTEKGVAYPTDAETESGTYPDAAAALMPAAVDLTIQPEGADSNFPYPENEESGVYPEIMAALHPSGAEILLDGETASAGAEYGHSGTVPDVSTGFSVASAEIYAQGETGAGKGLYEATGTYPDPAVGTKFTEVQVGLDGESAEGEINYPADAEAESGSVPVPAAILAAAESGVSVSADGAGLDLYYSTDADKETAEE